MKLSYYNHLFECDDRCYLYNVLSTAIVELNRATFDAVKEGLLQDVDEETRAGLVRLGFLVDSDKDELFQYQYFYDSVRYERSASVLHFTFIPTYSCNLACPYCLQGGAKAAKTISEGGVDAILKFIANAIKNPRNDVRPAKMYATLYGGEPMMAKAQLAHFCEGAKMLAEEAEIPVEFDMTSNMTLLDDQMIEMIAKYKIHVQASVDGTREQHDKRRIKYDGTGTYDIIESNLKKLVSAGLRDLITIRLNIDSESVDVAEATFAEMTRYSDDVYFAFLTSYKGVNDGYGDKCVTPDCYSTMAVRRFNQIVAKHGRKVAQPFGKKAPCAINCENKYWIDCELNVYKCELLVKMPECRVGYLTEDGEFHQEPALYKQMTLSPFSKDKCRSCKMLPLCGGGCPATAYIDKGVRDGDVSKFQCTFTSSSLTDYLVDYIRRSKKEKE